MSPGTLIPWLYMALFLAIGWRLYTIGWGRWIKAACAISIIFAPPMLVLIPALRHRAGDMTGLLIATATSMFLMGALCLAGGMVTAWLHGRTRRR